MQSAAKAKVPIGWLVPQRRGGAASRSQRGYRCICIGHEVAVLRTALEHEFGIARKGALAAS